MTALYIEWVDAKTWGSAYYGSEEIKELKLPIMKSRGEVVIETNTELFITQTTGDGEYHNIIGIPKGSILKRKKIP